MTNRDDNQNPKLVYNIGEIKDKLSKYFEDIKNLDEVKVPDEIKYYNNRVWKKEDENIDDATKARRNARVEKKIDDFFDAIIALYNVEGASENIADEGFGQDAIFRQYLKTKARYNEDPAHDVPARDVNEFFNSLIGYVSLVCSLNRKEQEKYLRMFPGDSVSQGMLACLEGAGERMQKALQNIHSRSLDQYSKAFLYAYDNVVEKYRSKVAPIVYEGNQPHIPAAISYLYGFGDGGKRFAISTSFEIPIFRAWEIEANKVSDFNNELISQRESDIKYVKAQLAKYELAKFNDTVELLEPLGMDLNDFMIKDIDGDIVDYEKAEWSDEAEAKYFPRIEVVSDGVDLPSNLFDQDTPRRLAEILRGDNKVAKLQVMKALDLMSRRRGGSIMQLRQTILELADDINTGMGILLSLIDDNDVDGSCFANVHSSIIESQDLMSNPSLTELLKRGCSTQKLIEYIRATRNSEEINNLSLDPILSHRTSSDAAVILLELLSNPIIAYGKVSEHLQTLIDHYMARNDHDLLESFFTNFPHYSVSELPCVAVYIDKILKVDKGILHLGGTKLTRFSINNAREGNVLYFLLKVRLPAFDAETKARLFLQYSDSIASERKVNSDAVVKMVKLLLDDGVDVNSAAYQGKKSKYAFSAWHSYSALHSAAFYTNEELVRVLLDYGANPELRNHRGDMPLHLAVLRGRVSVDIVRELIGHGVDINAVSSKERGKKTALHFAYDLNGHDDSYERRKELIKMLIENNANPSIPDANGDSILDLPDIESILKLLLEKQAPLSAYIKHDPIYIIAKTRLALGAENIDVSSPFIDDAINILLETEGENPSLLANIQSRIERPGTLISLSNSLRGRVNIDNKRELKDEIIPEAVLMILDNSELQGKYPDECASIRRKFTIVLEEDMAESQHESDSSVVQGRESSFPKQRAAAQEDDSVELQDENRRWSEQNREIKASEVTIN